MMNPTFDFSAFVDASKKAFAPAAKFNELTLKGFERVARQQLAFVGEMLEFSMQQMQLATTAKDFNDLTARQVELTTQFAEKATQRSQDLVKLSTEHQAEITKLFEKTVAETAQTAKKAA
ncbi:MAG: Phasin family protein [Steroidobacteraceae bacterium]|nr:Phasin family protein [Steroidobacteraceae bacterium]